MKNIFRIILFLLIVLSVQHSMANNKNDIYKAYISGDMVLWKQVIDKMEQQKPKTYSHILELINYQYGYIGWCVGNGKDSEASSYIPLAEKNIALLAKKTEYMSIVNSYQSAIYGYKITLNKFQAPLLGPKSVSSAQKSIALDSLNAHGYIQLGNTEYYMPAMFGGSKTKAVAYYEKALKILEKDQHQIKSDWNYLNLLTQLAIAYEETKQYSKAKLYYEKILKTEPEYQWVKNELYPSFLKKLNKPS